MNEEQNNNRGTDVQNTQYSQDAAATKITEFLIPGTSEGFRSRGGSASSFFSVCSFGSQPGAERNDAELPPKECDQKTMAERMQQEIEKMENATARQKNISIVVKTGLQRLKAILVELACISGEDSTQSEPSRSTKRVRSPADSPEQLAQIQKKKKPPTSVHPPAVVMHATDASAMSDTHADNPQEAWQTVPKKKKRKAKKGSPGQERPTDMTDTNRTVAKKGRLTHNVPKQRGGMVLIRPSDGQTFADVVRTIRTIDDGKNTFAVKGVTKTKDGAVLVRSTGNGRDLSGRLRDALGDQGLIKDMSPKVTLEILDMDCITDADEVRDALAKELKSAPDGKISVLGPNSRGQKIAICELDT